MRQLHERAELVGQHLGMAKEQADAAHAQEGVCLGLLLQIGDRLVAADVEKTHSQRVIVGVGMHVAVGGQLLFDRRGAGAMLEQVFGPQQPDSLGAV